MEEGDSVHCWLLGRCPPLADGSSSNAKVPFAEHLKQVHLALSKRGNVLAFSPKDACCCA